MQTRRDRTLRSAGAVLAGCALLMLLGGTVQARPDKLFTVGLGATSNDVTSGPDGTTAYGSSGAPLVLFAKPDAGYGLALLGGIAPWDYLGFEAMLLSSSHNATHSALPGETLDAMVGSLLAGVRVMLPLGDSFELFGRLGVGVYTLAYTKNAIATDGSRQDSVFSGTGYATGGGFATFIDPMGIELGLLQQKATLDQVSVDSNDYGIPETDLALTTVTLIVTVHFGNR